MVDIIIIGAGPAGLSAALYASRAGASVKIIEGGAPGGKLNLTADIENYPGIKKKMGPELAYEMFEHGLSFGATLDMKEVVSIEDHGDYKAVITTSSKEDCKYVIIATGTKERTLGLPHEQELTGRGISYCAVCDGPFYRNKDVAVIGGGNSAIEEAIYLSSLVNTVHIIMRRDVFRADTYLVEKAKSIDNIIFHLNQIPYEYKSEDNKISGLVIQDVNTKELSTLDISGIFPYIGLDPMTSFVENLHITNNKGYIPVDDHMETSIKGIFAIGDVRDKELRQVVTATNDGAIAGQYIAKLIRER